MWGVRVTLGMDRMGWPGGMGSGSMTSRAAAAIQPSVRAWHRALVSTTGPRDMFIRMALGFIRRSWGALIRPRVSGVRGTWREM